MQDQPLSLRSRQKLVVRNAVLDAALDLFSSAGYQKATMNAIADQAGIGIATLFRHFRTKAAILADLMRRDVEEGFAESQKIVDQPPADPRKGLVGLMHTVSKILDKPSKALKLKPYLWPAMLTGRGEADDVVSEADEKLRRQIGALVAHYQDIGALRPALDADDLTMILFYLFNSHYVDFINGSIGSRAELDRRVERRVAVTLESWV